MGVIYVVVGDVSRARGVVSGRLLSARHRHDEAGGLYVGRGETSRIRGRTAGIRIRHRLHRRGPTCPDLGPAAIPSVMARRPSDGTTTKPSHDLASLRKDRVRPGLGRSLDDDGPRTPGDHAPPSPPARSVLVCTQTARQNAATNHDERNSSHSFATAVAAKASACFKITIAKTSQTSATRMVDLAATPSSARSPTRWTLCQTFTALPACCRPSALQAPLARLRL